MSRKITQPINQVKLTNVAVVRMNKGGKRFEIACYRNKVVDFRQGLETDLSEVLQTERVFTNVSKGEFAKAKDLQKVFGTKDEEEISKTILLKGQVQVSDKERNIQLEKTTSQIAEWVSKNCVHPTSDRPYTISQIKRAMQQANFSVHPTKPLKRQNLECVKLLQTVISIQRAKMELQLLIPSTSYVQIEEVLNANRNNVIWDPPSHSAENDDDDDDDKQLDFKVLVDPSLYRLLNEVTQQIIGARIEIVNQVVTKQGDVDLESEVMMMTTTSAAAAAASSASSSFPTGHVDEEGNNDEVDNDLDDQFNDMNISSVRGKNDKKNDDDNDEEDDDDDDDDNDDPFVNLSSRKKQNKARKKNKKAQRREKIGTKNHNENEIPISTTTTTSTATKQTSATVATTCPPVGNTSTTTSSSSNSKTDNSGTTRKSCNTCGGFFDSAAAYRTHFKSDWHRFNQKLKLNGSPPISEEEFLLVDSDTFFGSTST